MELTKLGLNRNLGKNPSQNDETKGSVYSSSNPVPKSSGQSSGGEQQRGNEKDDGSKNILTGTVITSCIIQTTALPSRVEMAGNDIKFFDDTFSENGEVKGDTSQLVFTHDIGATEGFIIEKRASAYDTYDNVISWYATPARAGRHNYMFIGRNGNSVFDNGQRHTNFINFNVDHDSDFDIVDPGQQPLNGVWRMEYSEDGIMTDGDVTLAMGSTDTLTNGAIPNGFSTYIAAGHGGIVGLAYRSVAAPHAPIILLYLLNESAIMIGADMLPDAPGAYDIGAPGSKMGTFYGSVVACPLPTVENPIALLEKIPAPAHVGERGHYGERLYFDDLTFPPELLHTTQKGNVEIEHTTMIGFLLQTVIDLNSRVKALEARLSE